MKHIAAALIVLPLASFVFGMGASTLYWSEQMTRQFRAQAEWKAVTDKAVDVIGFWKGASEGWEAVARKNERVCENASSPTRR